MNDPDRLFPDSPCCPDPSADPLATLELRYAAYFHVTHARPFFGILGPDQDHMIWQAGGADMADLVHAAHVRPPLALTELFGRLGIDTAVVPEIRSQIDALAPEGLLSFASRLEGRDDRAFSLLCRRQSEESGALVQFALTDITGFVAGERKVRRLAASLSKRLDDPVDDGPSVRQRLEDLGRCFLNLLGRAADDEIEPLARRMVQNVEAIVNRSVTLLRRFEDLEPDWQPPRVPAPAPAMGSWPDIRRHLEEVTAGRDSFTAEETVGILYAESFVRNAVSTFILAAGADEFLVLNAPRPGCRYRSVDALVRALGIEANSTRTAIEFFERIARGDASATFAMGDSRVEARGRPLSAGGSQAYIAPATTGGLDIRGLFHGFKNLLLQLQVLHVVRTRDDLVQVHDGLADTMARIRDRLNVLDSMATGRIRVPTRPETVASWVRAARRAVGPTGTVAVEMPEDLATIVFAAIPGEMEDSLTELVRNAFHHDARRVRVRAERRGDHLALVVADDGTGATDDKIRQLRQVTTARRYDPGLTTRPDGTGTGLLGIANAAARFLDGSVAIDHNPDGRGLQVTLTMKLPPAERTRTGNTS